MCNRLHWFAVLLLIFAAHSAFAAGLVVPPGGITLGEVQPGDAIEKTVVISNDAERTISVSRVKACCGGVAELVPMAVPAKGEAKLTLKMKAQIPGEIAKAVTLSCDDPHQPIIEIPVTGRVVETAEVKMMAGGTRDRRQAWVNIPRGRRPSCRRPALYGVHPCRGYQGQETTRFGKMI